MEEYEKRCLFSNKSWIKENQGKFCCHCGCKQEIQIKFFHKIRGIPLYIVGHSSKDEKLKKEVIKGLNRTRKDLYLRNKGKHLSPNTEFKKGMVSWNKNKTNIYSKETLKLMKIKKQGKHYSIATEFKKGQNIKEKHWNWKGGVISLYEQIRNLEEYNQWRNEIFKRDNYTCQNCSDSVGNNLEAHHIKSFIEILQDFLQVYNQFSPIEDKETLVRLAMSYQLFWDTMNGITLCKECHMEVKICKNKK